MSRSASSKPASVPVVVVWNASQRCRPMLSSDMSVPTTRSLRCYFSCSFFFSSRRRHTILQGDWSSDVCSSDLASPDHYPAPYAILELWRRYDGDPFAPRPEDPASVIGLLEGDTARNLIRIFFLQERLKSLGKGSDFKAKRVHVIGAGVMGGDIAAWCAMRGLTVTLQDQSPERLAPAMKRAAELFKRRLRDKSRIRDALDRLIPDVAGDGARHADVVIEAIFENLQAKRELFEKLEAAAKPEALLASNTSSLKLADIGAKFEDPSRLVGIHFFNPVPQLQLVEVVKGAATDSGVAKRAAAFVRQIDKLPLPVKDSPGFLVNRVLGPYIDQALRMVDEGVARETLDAAVTAVR